MSGLSVEMLSSIVSQLAGQGLTLPQGNTSNVGHSIVNEDEVLVGNEEIFTMEELISKRKRNEKATQAQQTFSYVLREAAKISGLWDSAPLFREISSKVMEKFISKVTNALPTLNCHNGKKKIKERFSDMMTYRRNHLKNTKFWKRSEKLKKYGMVRETRPTANIQEPVAISTVEVVQQKLDKNGGCEFQRREEVLVIHDNDKVARAGFLKQSSSNETYAKLKMTANYSRSNGQRKIKLDGPNGEKFLEVIENNRKFYWPISGIKQKGPYARGRSGGKRNATSSKARSASKSPPATVTLEEASSSTAVSASLSPPPTPPTKTSTEPALPKGTPPPTTPQELHRTTPLPQLTPPPSQPSTPQVIDNTYATLSQSSTTCIKGRKKKRFQPWVYVPVTDNNEQEAEELPKKRPRKTKTVFDA
ncbi:hypothetical protein P5673_031309 [Acropora cervicornis]|uniref:Uncharacterized protein n=1 Tax=Acropora cervicornis TaxID=6130 RepID=A0AAD9USM9_ACRCE|nr:hypothetical protein P5673_031309 [Acropora cervicornis]